jgi:Protein of unknown function (DUF2844)
MKFCIAALVLLVCVSPLRASAALGGNVASVEADQSQFKGSVELRQTAAFNVQQIKADDGTTIREFVSPSGTVFAVAWSGPFVPDLHQLLGTYFDQYSAGVSAQKSTYIGRRPLNLQLPGLVVQMHGHMRAYYGRAYLPQQVPAGVKPEDLW